jgi:transcriptional regulator with XRE-family HTH domain
MSMDIQYLSKEDFIKSKQNHWEKTGEIYKKARLANKLTRREVCAILGISEGKLCNFEHGKPVLEVKLLKAALRLIYKELNQKSYKKILQCEKVMGYLNFRSYFEGYSISVDVVKPSLGDTNVHLSFGNSDFGSTENNKYGFEDSSFDKDFN